MNMKTFIATLGKNPVTLSVDADDVWGAAHSIAHNLFDIYGNPHIAIRIRVKANDGSEAETFDIYRKEGVLVLEEVKNIDFAMAVTCSVLRALLDNVQGGWAHSTDQCDALPTPNAVITFLNYTYDATTFAATICREKSKENNRDICISYIVCHNREKVVSGHSYCSSTNAENIEMACKSMFKESETLLKMLCSKGYYENLRRILSKGVYALQTEKKG